jgi:hypothetical protein
VGKSEGNEGYDGEKGSEEKDGEGGGVDNGRRPKIVNYLFVRADTAT